MVSFILWSVISIYFIEKFSHFNGNKTFLVFFFFAKIKTQNEKTSGQSGVKTLHTGTKPDFNLREIIGSKTRRRKFQKPHF